MKCRPANQVIFVPNTSVVLDFPNWYILYKEKEDKPYPVYVLDATQYDNYSLKPSENICNTVWNSQQTGKCDLIFASCDDPMNTYGRQTEDSGHGENMSYISARVVNPWGKPFPYSQQQTYTAFKHYGYWDDKAIDFKDSYLALVTFRQIPQSKWSLNKSFGTPLEMIERVIQQDWNPLLNISTISTVNTRTLDGFGRLLTLQGLYLDAETFVQLQNIFADISGTGFQLDGKNITLKGLVNITIAYPSNVYPGITI